MHCFVKTNTIQDNLSVSSTTFSHGINYYIEPGKYAMQIAEPARVEAGRKYFRLTHIIQFIQPGEVLKRLHWFQTFFNLNDVKVILVKPWHFLWKLRCVIDFVMILDTSTPILYSKKVVFNVEFEFCFVRFFIIYKVVNAKILHSHKKRHTRAKYRVKDRMIYFIVWLPKHRPSV